MIKKIKIELEIHRLKDEPLYRYKIIIMGTESDQREELISDWLFKSNEEAKEAGTNHIELALIEFKKDRKDAKVIRHG